MIEYTMQLSARYPESKDGLTRPVTRLGFIDVQAENSRDARNLAKKLYEEKHPDTDVYIHHGVSDASSSPYILKQKHIK